MGMSVREMKAQLAALGVSYADITEKSELRSRFEEARSSGAGTACRPPCAPSTSSSSAASDSAADSGGPAALDLELRRILGCTPGDHYTVLEVPRDADADALKRAYRKLALRWHPDKCHLQGASEAFKRVSVAYAVLRDPAQQRHVDFLGPEAAAGGARAGADGARFAGSQFRGQDAEELFGAFYGSRTSSGGLGCFFSGMAAPTRLYEADAATAALWEERGQQFKVD